MALQQAHEIRTTRGPQKVPPGQAIIVIAALSALAWAAVLGLMLAIRAVF